MMPEVGGSDEAGRALPGSETTANATLELRLQGAAPEGSLSASDGIRWAFSGWTELGAVIEEWWRSEADARSTERRAKSGSDYRGELMEEQ
jgi:hypothetical protein